MKTWFEDSELQTKSMQGESKISSGPSKPTERDVNEATIWIEKETKKTQHFIKGLFLSAAIFESLVYTFIQFDNAIYVHIAASILASIAVWAFAISASANLKPVLLQTDTSKPIKSDYKSLLNVFATTMALLFMTLVALPFFIIPACVVVVMLIRAPYNAALGYSFKEAFFKSIEDRNRFPTGNLLLAITFINTLFSIGFLVLVFEMLGPWIPWGLEDAAFHMIKAFMLYGIWAQSFACCLVGDAYFCGAIPPETLAEHRNPSTTLSRFWNGFSKLGPAFILALFFVLTQTDFRQPQNPKPFTSQEMIWEMGNLEGTISSSESYDDKPVVIYAWATWCLPCKIQMPHIKKLHKEKSDKYHVLSMVFSYNDTKQVIDYAEKYELPYPVLYGTHAFQERAKVSAFPTTMVIKNKKIVDQWTGVTSARRIKKALDG